ncbi:hypothetical protein HYH02_009858 [Chlamydomonas schloesseri]|uniref:Uncharacterized protein n=1 Tax=Chlamydomonas schloesseri TaxID=2026947 RepID=A0A835TE66_9CHLO|nr:hypothetical protein HYH02_009858 [Chlamydomonas schloesseri]|eukprot:KAG2442067.1 hypothetical protein HYH02_009858 [Chlamydomonas schloesseri]
MLHLLKLARRTTTSSSSCFTGNAAALAAPRALLSSPWAGSGAATATATSVTAASGSSSARLGIRAASGTRHTSLPGDPDLASAPPPGPDAVFPGPGPGSSSLAGSSGSSSISSTGGSSPMQQAAAAGDASHARGDPRGGDHGSGGVVAPADDPMNPDLLTSPPLDSPLLEQAQTGIGAGVGGGTGAALAAGVGTLLGGPAVGLAAGALGALSGAAVGGAVAAERDGNQAGDVVQLSGDGGKAPAAGGGGGDLPAAEDPARLRAAEQPVVEVGGSAAGSRGDAEEDEGGLKFNEDSGQQ